jgi:hypothetical protein
MWRPGAALAVLLLALVMTSLVHRGEQRRTSSRPESVSTLRRSTDRADAISGRNCGRAVIRDWADNARIDHAYARQCYELALRSVPEDGRTPLIDAVVSASKGLRDY